MKKYTHKYVGFGFVMLSAASLPLTISAQVTPQIIGGSDAKIEEVPWQVVILAKDSLWCGGSIIAKRWILTAAHCLDGTPRKIRAGVTDHTTKGQDRVVTHQFIHGDYKGDYSDIMNNDIALLKLERDLDLSGNTAKAIPRMTYDLASTGLQAPGKTALISGWGNTQGPGKGDTQILQKANVRIIANDHLKLKYPKGELTNAMIVAGYINGNIDTCNGDSGGPLAVEDDTVSVGYRLAGITSYSRGGCAAEGYPTVYTKVSNFEDWITNTMKYTVPTMTISDTYIIEGDTLNRNTKFLVKLSYKSSSKVSVKYETVDGSATAGSDYEETVGTLSFDPGQVAKTILVPIISDKIAEGRNENFFMKLSSPNGAIVIRSQGEAQIRDND